MKRQAIYNQVRFFVALASSALIMSCAHNITYDDEVKQKDTQQSESELAKEIIGKDGAPMILIPAGTFDMGNQYDIHTGRSVGGKNEKPVHTVQLNSFYIDKYEVNNERYQKFLNETGHKMPTYGRDPKYNAPSYPVVGIDWLDAKAYCDWAGKRLPTEAEWEKAARGGLVGKKYPWGNEKPTNETCNLTEGIPWIDDGYSFVAPIGSFAPNGYGLYDMAGNVKEWCADLYDEEYYSKSPRKNPQGPKRSSHLRGSRVIRGGSWKDGQIRVSDRDFSLPRIKSRCIGFRCVTDVNSISNN